MKKLQNWFPNRKSCIELGLGLADMSLFRKIKQKAGITASNKLLSKDSEYALHEKVAVELEKGEKNLGVWTAAFAKSKGDEKKAEAKYIELMVQYYKDQIAAGTELTELMHDEYLKQVLEEKNQDLNQTQLKRESQFQNIQTELGKKGFTVNKRTTGYRVIEPLGGHVKFHSLPELQEYADKYLNDPRY